MAGMASLLRKPFKMSPSPITLVRLHQEELRERAIEAVEVEESTNHPQIQMGPPPPAAAVKGSLCFPSFRAPSRLYSATLPETGIYSGFCPEKILVTPIQLSGPTRGDATAAISSFSLNLALNSSASQQKFCFFVSAAADDGDQNYVGAKIPNLNSSPLDVSAPVTELVSEIRSDSISRFADFVQGYLAENGSGEELNEYIKIMSSLTEAQISNLDSIRIWNILTLGDEIRKAFAEKGVIETAMRFDDLPPPQQQLLAPPHGYKATVNYAIDYNYSYNYSYKHCYIDDNETLLSDARNYEVPDGDQRKESKRKAVVAGAEMGDLYLSDHLQMKRARHGGVLRIEEPIEPVYETEDSDSWESWD